MDRLAEQVVAWHNRHPLAKRITIYDVHTIGVVALPFMRGGRVAAPPPPELAEPIEPVLTDEVSPESLAAALHDESTIAANENAARLDALADQEELPRERPRWMQLLGGLFKQSAGRKSAFGRVWPAFSERFVDGLTPRRIANFAQDNGFDTRPGDDTWPQRVVPIDDRMATAGGDGGWPFEIYLQSAAIDAGRSRTRVLIGRGGFKPPVLGRRCMDPKRLGPVVAVVLALVGGMAFALWPRSDGHGKVDGPAAAASAASSAASAAPSAASVAAPHASAPASAAPVAEPASAPASSTITPVQAGEPASAASAPDIRPQLVEPLRDPAKRTPSLRGVPASASKPASEPAAAALGGSPRKSEKAEPAPERPTSAASALAPRLAPLAEESRKVLPQVSNRADVQEAIASGKQVVALVGPPMKEKAEAEALLAKMREHIAPMQRDPDSLQAQIFKSPDGWRAAVWPFGSRAEAQLINATLIARGMRTKAVSF